MTEYLIQKKTGRIYVKTDAYMQRDDMEPYVPPETEKNEKPDIRKKRKNKKRE